MSGAQAYVLFAHYARRFLVSAQASALKSKLWIQQILVCRSTERNSLYLQVWKVEHTVTILPNKSDLLHLGPLLLFQIITGSQLKLRVNVVSTCQQGPKYPHLPYLSFDLPSIPPFLFDYLIELSIDTNL